jgi:rubrerythrin
MSEASSIGEVLELAIMREMQAVDFYIGTATRTEDPTLRSVLERLAEAEFGHKARLELEVMKEGLVAKAAGRLIEGGEADYARELELGPGAELIDILAVAMEKERKAFRFYADLAGIMSENEVRDVILELAEEEVRHLVSIEVEYNRLTAPPEE